MAAKKRAARRFFWHLRASSVAAATLPFPGRFGGLLGPFLRPRSLPRERDKLLDRHAARPDEAAQRARSDLAVVGH